VVLARRIVHRPHRPQSGDSTVVEPPTREQGARRVWSDSRGRIWVSEWLSGNLSLHDPAAAAGASGACPATPAAVRGLRRRPRQGLGQRFRRQRVFRFDPASERFERFALPRDNANVRQIHGRPARCGCRRAAPSTSRDPDRHLESAPEETLECAMSMADRDGKIWMDGALVDWRDAKIHVLTHTLHYGCGAFEGVRAYNTVNGTAIFRLQEHTQRLFNSAKILRMKIPFSFEEVFEAQRTVVRENKLESCYLRRSPGSAPRSSASRPRATRCT
jgi:hypothetical protein